MNASITLQFSQTDVSTIQNKRQTAAKN